MYRITLLFAFFLGLLRFGNAQTIVFEYKSIYKEIDVARHNSAIEIFNGNNQELKQQTIDSIIKDPNNYNPPVLFALSRELLIQDKIDEGAYWFCIAQLRGRYDANLCMDKSAIEALFKLMDEYGPVFYDYALQNIEKHQKIVSKAVNYVRANNENYDHRWINLHGIDAFSVSMGDKPLENELSQPKNKWKKIKKNTINDYYNSYMEEFERKKKINIVPRTYNLNLIAYSNIDTANTTYIDKERYTNLSDVNFLPEIIKPYYYYIKSYILFKGMNLNDYWIENSEDIKQDSSYIYLLITHSDTFKIRKQLDNENNEARKNATKGETYPVRAIVGNPSGKDRFIKLEKSTRKIIWASLTN